MARSGRAAGERRVVIVGAGLAGLFTALKLAPLPVSVLAAHSLGHGASSDWAQAGIAAAVGEGDTPEAHAADTIAVGCGIANEAVARLMAAEAGRRVEDLLAYGVPFDRDIAGRLALRREAAHTARRIVSVRGDMAGRQIMEALIQTARAAGHISFLEGYEAEELVLTGGQAGGVVIRQSSGMSNVRELVPASAVVLATGGVGRLYAVTTNAEDARGEGVAMAVRAGAVAADAEFVQFHPTAIDAGRDPAPLATEALRGEGARLVNGAGDAFMAEIHELGDLAPRDVVARAVHRERVAGRGAFLDCRGALGNEMAEAFPTVHAFCIAAGIDPARDLIPVAPAAHYHMGGVLTDASGRTTLDGLWACGEVASTGVHGANRLASNSLLEAVVFGARVAEDIKAARLSQFVLRAPGGVRVPPPTTGRLSDAEMSELRRVMAEHVGVERDRASLRAALATLHAIGERLARAGLTANALVTARLIATAALAREESRGGHYRSDFPATDPRLARRSMLTLADLDREGAEHTERGRGVNALVAPPRHVVREAVERALAEDLGRRGDITTDSVIAADATGRWVIAARARGVIAGLDCAASTFAALDPDIAFEPVISDGTPVEPGMALARIAGRVRPVLAGERTALNFLCHLSGIASLTARFVALAHGTRARIVCTRKTTPGLRALQKYAVRAGGGGNHRFGLDDAILIKDNHVAAAGGVAEAISAARAHAGHMLTIEIEVDSLDQLETALRAGAGIVLLDNMEPGELARAVEMTAGRAVLEASGGVNEDTVAAIASTGVDLISVGRITQSAPALDLGLDVAD